MAEFKIDLTDNTGDIINAIEELTQAALEAVGQTAERHAKEGAPVGTTLSTNIKDYHGGALRKSLTHKVVGDDVFIGTNIRSSNNAPYAVYVEMGTGIYATEGNGRQSPWVWRDKNGKFHSTRGMKPTHFLKKAISSPEHINEYKAVIKAVFEGKNNEK